MQKRVLILLGTTAILLVGLVGILGFAHAFALDQSKRCFPGFMHAQWPKWIGCAMATHENLAGGLIAAAGALIAAMIAAGAVWQQIVDARKQIAITEGRRQYLEGFSLVRASSYYSRFLRFFEDAKGPEHLKFINGLDAIYKSGGLVPFFGTLPDIYQYLAPEVWERLSQLNNALTRSREGSTPDAASASDINEGIRQVYSDIKQYRDLIEKRIAEIRAKSPHI